MDKCIGPPLRSHLKLVDNHLVMADFVQGLDASKLILAEVVSIYTFHGTLALVTLAFIGPLIRR